MQRDFSIKEVELKHLTLQLELLTNQNAARVNELQEQIAALKVSFTLSSYQIVFLNIMLPHKSNLHWTSAK